MKTIVTNTYKCTSNDPNPKWKLKSHTVVTIYAFDAVDHETGEVINTTYLHHRYQSTLSHNMYHGCDYRFSGYNPTPITDWFRGVPLNQMLEWCGHNDLYSRGEVKKFVTNEYVG